MIVLTSHNVNAILSVGISKAIPHLVKQILAVNHYVIVDRAALMIHVEMKKSVMKSVLKLVETRLVVFITV